MESKEPLRNVYSPTHAVEVKHNGQRRSVVSFESQAGKEPEDFQLFYTRSAEDFGVTLLTHRDAGKDGYFLLMISPKDDWSEQEYTTKDIVSLAGHVGRWRQERWRKPGGLLYGIRILRPQDRFNVVSFAGENGWWKRE